MTFNLGSLLWLPAHMYYVFVKNLITLSWFRFKLTLTCALHHTNRLVWYFLCYLFLCTSIDFRLPGILYDHFTFFFSLSVKYLSDFIFLFSLSLFLYMQLFFILDYQGFYMIILLFSSFYLFNIYLILSFLTLFLYFYTFSFFYFRLPQILYDYFTFLFSLFYIYPILSFFSLYLHFFTCIFSCFHHFTILK